jgi:ABC-type Fe3+-hydroxamate transport system substrate-binding protein
MIFKDQMNQTIRLGEYPKRIVSLVPSQTELLFDLGLEEEVVGITKFCIHPNHWFQTKTRVGGTKNIHIDKVRALQPDLIIGNKEENTKEDIEALSEIAPVWMSDIYTLEDALSMIGSVGDLTNKADQANTIVTKIKQGFNEFNLSVKSSKVVYLIWKNPFMVAAKQTFIDDILNRIGFENFFTEERYPKWDLSREEKPPFIFLSSEPYPFNEQDIKDLQQKFPESQVKLVDGEYFSWYGSRLIKAIPYFRELLNET